MGFKCGIVGLPNVGKSTLFNALTKAGIAASNYPFCTIDPNVGVVPVPDPRLQRISEIARPARVIPTSMEFVDIAGLVSGASRGEGLGNQFLAHVRETDAIAHVVRCFEDDDVTHVAGGIDPVRDIEVIDTELALADLATVEKALDKAGKQAKAGEKEARARVELLERVSAHLDAGEHLRTMRLPDGDWQALRDYQLLTLKPVLFIANVSESVLGRSPDSDASEGGLGKGARFEVPESGLQDSPFLEAVRDAAAGRDAGVVPVCAAIEQELAELDDDERAEFLAHLGLQEPGLDRLIRAGYELLGLLTFFTAGPKEVRAWPVRAGATAPVAAGRIHTDFQRGFIRAEVIAYDDYIRHGGESGARDAGRLRVEGKDYVIREGDIVHFRFNV